MVCSVQWMCSSNREREKVSHSLNTHYCCSCFPVCWLFFHFPFLVSHWVVKRTSLLLQLSTAATSSCQPVHYTQQFTHHHYQHQHWTSPLFMKILQYHRLNRGGGSLVFFSGCGVKKSVSFIMCWWKFVPNQRHNLCNNKHFWKMGE